MASAVITWSGFRVQLAEHPLRIVRLPFTIAKRDYWTFWESEFDSGSTRMYLTTRDLTSWSQPYRDNKCTKQLYSVWILPVNYKWIMNRHARRIDPRVDKLASETHGPSCSDYRVAWDFDSPWITGPMTAHQSVAYVRHIILAPAANLCTLSAIVFLPIKAWIWRHIRRYPGRGRSWIARLAGIPWLGPNSEPRGNNRSFPETRERARAPVKKIGSSDSIFGLVNSTYFFKITNHNQHAFNIKYLANLIKKYWTCFRCQKLADFLVCFPPSVRVQVRRPPSWKICLRIKLSFGFWGRAVKAFDNFSRNVGMTIENNILEVLVEGFVSPILQI